MMAGIRQGLTRTPQVCCVQCLSAAALARSSCLEEPCLRWLCCRAGAARAACHAAQLSPSECCGFQMSDMHGPHACAQPRKLLVLRIDTVNPSRHGLSIAPPRSVSQCQCTITAHHLSAHRRAQAAHACSTSLTPACNTTHHAARCSWPPAVAPAPARPPQPAPLPRCRNPLFHPGSRHRAPVPDPLAAPVRQPLHDAAAAAQRISRPTCYATHPIAAPIAPRGVKSRRCQQTHRWCHCYCGTNSCRGQRQQHQWKQRRSGAAHGITCRQRRRRPTCVARWQHDGQPGAAARCQRWRK